MNQHPFHIDYNNGLHAPLKKAIESVLDNFSNFLSYNEYKHKEVHLSIGTDSKSTIQISSIFSNCIIEQKFDHKYWFAEKPLIEENGNLDYIGTCFYMINSIQEYAEFPKDKLGRFLYENTYQYKFSCPEENLVLEYFQELAKLIFGEKIPLKKSSYLLTHDIDFVNSAWKDQLKDGVKNLDIKSAIQTSKKLLSNNDDWQNIEQILADEILYKVSSIFFWLPVKGKTKYPKVLNADYNINDNYIQECMQKISASTLHKNGLHKSISEKSLDEENAYISNEKHLRFHYLNFDVKRDYEKISISSLAYDYSLGFSKQIGFRNSYGLPFRPVNPYTLEYYNFVSFPLHIMDSSLFYYMGITDPDDMVKALKKFIEEHAQSCVLGLLWHNNFYEEKSYQKLLKIIADKLLFYKVPNF